MKSPVHASIFQYLWLNDSDNRGMYLFIECLMISSKCSSQYTLTKSQYEVTDPEQTKQMV